MASGIKLPAALEGALESLLADYVAGRLGPAMHSLVQAHLELSSVNRPYVAALESAQGSLVEELEPMPVRDRDAKLAAIFGLDPADGTPAETVPADPVLPPSLRRLVGRPITDIPWRFTLPGMKEFRLVRDGRGEAMLYWVKGGKVMPTHTHEGLEVTLVLKGSYRDVLGHHRRGDMTVADDTVDHRPVVDSDEDCICYAVVEAPRRLTGPLGRILGRLLPR